MLNEAIKYGFKDKNKLQADPLLNSLHGMPDFEDLLK